MQQADAGEIPASRYEAAPGGAGWPAAASPGSARSRLAMAALRSLAQEIGELAERVSSVLEDPLEMLSPGSEEFSRIARRTVPRWHFAMLNDDERNSALTAALRRSIPAGATVLEIGTGSGLIAMAAARAGAGKVITCEMNPLLAEVARQVVDAHGMSGTIAVVGKPSDRLRIGEDLDAPVDVLVSEIVDCGLVGEGLLPSTRHARENLLAPGGIMLPSAARLYGQLVHSEAVMGLNQVGKAGGFDVSPVNALATRGHFPVRLGTWPFQMMSDPAELVAFDLARDALLPGERMVSLPVTSDGEAHALVVWFELDLGRGVVLGNSPANTASHWMQALVPFAAPVPVEAGATASFRLRWSDYLLSVHH